MSSLTRILSLALILSASAVRAADDEAPAPAADAAPAKQWVWLAKQGVWGYGYQIKEGPHSGLWRIDANSKRRPAPAGDPYGFATILNRFRAFDGPSARGL